MLEKLIRAAQAMGHTRKDCGPKLPARIPHLLGVSVVVARMPGTSAALVEAAGTDVERTARTRQRKPWE